MKLTKSQRKERRRKRLNNIKGAVKKGSRLIYKHRAAIKKHIIDNPHVRKHVKAHLKKSKFVQKAIHKGIEFATKNPKAAKAGLKMAKKVAGRALKAGMQAGYLA